MTERLRLVPLTLAQANYLVWRLHRHRDPVTSHRFSVGAVRGPALVGAAITGRRVGRGAEPYTVAEVARLATDGTPNACSLLYAACARAAKALGYEWIQTFTLAHEPGTSLLAAGWEPFPRQRQDGHGWESREGRRETGDEDDPRQRWRKALNPPLVLPAGVLLSNREVARRMRAEPAQMMMWPP